MSTIKLKNGKEEIKKINKKLMRNVELQKLKLILKELKGENRPQIIKDIEDYYDKFETFVLFYKDGKCPKNMDLIGEIYAGVYSKTSIQKTIEYYEKENENHRVITMIGSKSGIVYSTGESIMTTELS
ncbi:hypothetical protein Biyabedamokiny2_00075 [Staphylococcus phage Biyabeda-mokiny_2]|nr:hypothetical protein Biyabedamokiny2_00075 [Staphylococcus phage Biyabeda-mokiny_2]